MEVKTIIKEGLNKKYLDKKKVPRNTVTWDVSFSCVYGSIKRGKLTEYAEVLAKTSNGILLSFLRERFR